jgi:PKD repeat protein
MKRIICISLSITFILLSCHKETPIPQSSFSTDVINPEVGQSVFFTNTSINASSYEWNFGDGFTSTESDPVHVFTATGSYEVTLTAFSSGGENKSSITINVQVPTLLVIEVREYYSNDLIPNASVLLYPTLADWDAQTNSVSEAFTDLNGVAVFSNLNSYVFYVDVWEATHDNYTLRGEDVGFIRTPQVLPHTITGFIAYVDVADHSSGRGNRNMIIKKLERKSAEKILVPSYSGTQNWQEFYNRKVKK